MLQRASMHLKILDPEIGSMGLALSWARELANLNKD